MTMVEVKTYDFKPLTENKVKPEESFINAYVDKCLDSEGIISSTHRIRRTLDTKYKKSNLNKIVDEQCLHLSPNKREILLHISEKMKVCSMEHWVSGKSLR